jgi:hypothetical protein
VLRRARAFERIARPPIRLAAGSFTDRHFKYLLVLPAIFVTLLIGPVAVIHSLLASFQFNQPLSA